MQILRASEGMVYCNGYSKTSIGGAVYLPDGIEHEWREMTEEEADEIIAENNPPEPIPEEEATEADYIEALARLGVTE